MRYRHWQLLIIFGAMLVGTIPVNAQESESPSSEPGIRELQSSISARFRRFERTLTQLRDYLEQTDPTRAELLTRVTSQSRESRINDQLEMILELLSRDVPQYASIVERQDDLIQSLISLLDLLQSEDERQRIAEEMKRIEELIADLNKMVIREKGIRSGTERGQPLDDLEGKQNDLKEDAQDLADKIDQQDREAAENSNSEESSESNSENKSNEESSNSSESKPSDSESSESKPSDAESSENSSESNMSENSSESSESSPSSESQPQQSGQPPQSSPSQSQPQQTPGREQLERAIQKMQQAIDELKEQNRDGASQEQDQVIAELEKAKAELEERLRQLREEEMKILLASLESRFRRILQMELEVRKGTGSLEKVAEEERLPRHRAKSRQLARDQSTIVGEVDQAMILLREEGSSLAFPEAIQAMREDMVTVTERLENFLVDSLTVRIENDIIEALQEMIDALRQQLEDLEQQQQQPGQQQSEEQDPALINQLAELKILRSMQQRINRRTVSYNEAMSESPNPDSDIIKLLEQLSDRQARVQRAAYDLATGKNQ